MPHRSVVPRLMDIIEAIERVRQVTSSVSLDGFESDWAKRWLLELVRAQQDDAGARSALP